MSEMTTYERYRLGESYVVAGDPLAAARILEPAVEAEPDSATLWLLLARAYFASARLGRAQAAYERLIELDPTDHHAHFGAGRALERQSRYGDALTHYRIAQALASVPDYAAAVRRLAGRRAAASAPGRQPAGSG